MTDDFWRPWGAEPACTCGAEWWNPNPPPCPVHPPVTFFLAPLRFPWICPRCSASNAPHVDRCACSAVITHGATTKVTFQSTCLSVPPCKGPRIDFSDPRGTWHRCACGACPIEPAWGETTCACVIDGVCS